MKSLSCFGRGSLLTFLLQLISYLDIFDDVLPHHLDLPPNLVTVTARNITFFSGILGGGDRPNVSSCCLPPLDGLFFFGLEFLRNTSTSTILNVKKNPLFFFVMWLDKLSSFSASLLMVYQPQVVRPGFLNAIKHYKLPTADFFCFFSVKKKNVLEGLPRTIHHKGGSLSCLERFVID